MTGSGARMAWQTRTIDVLGLRLDFLAGVTVTEGVFEEASYLLQVADPLMLGIWYGRHQDLATFHSGFGPNQPVTFGAEQQMRICGQRARRQTAVVSPGVRTVGLIVGPDGSLGHLSSMSEGITQVAVALRRGDQGVLLRWQVPTAERAAYRDAETHFFGAIECS